jgi:hypothetical protein
MISERPTAPGATPFRIYAPIVHLGCKRPPARRSRCRRRARQRTTRPRRCARRHGTRGTRPAAPSVPRHRYQPEDLRLWEHADDRRSHPPRGAAHAATPRERPRPEQRPVPRAAPAGAPDSVTEDPSGLTPSGMSADWAGPMPGSTPSQPDRRGAAPHAKRAAMPEASDHDEGDTLPWSGPPNSAQSLPLRRLPRQGINSTSAESAPARSDPGPSPRIRRYSDARRRLRRGRPG